MAYKSYQAAKEGDKYIVHDNTTIADAHKAISYFKNVWKGNANEVRRLRSDVIITCSHGNPMRRKCIIFELRGYSITEYRALVEVDDENV
jgi:hypothetical protein